MSIPAKTKSETKVRSQTVLIRAYRDEPVALEAVGRLGRSVQVVGSP